MNAKFILATFVLLSAVFVHACLAAPAVVVDEEERDAEANVDGDAAYPVLREPATSGRLGKSENLDRVIQQGQVVRFAPGAYPVYYAAAHANGRFRDGKSIRAYSPDEFEGLKEYEANLVQ